MKAALVFLFAVALIPMAQASPLDEFVSCPQGQRPGDAGVTNLLALGEAVEKAEAPDPKACVKAAVEATNAQYPLHQKTAAKFYEWGSYNHAAWDTFQTENLGFSESENLAPGTLDEEIAQDFQDDPSRKKALLEMTKGRPVTGVTFEFQGGTLERFFVTEPDGNGGCKVMHLDQKLDDFDNG